MSKESTNEVVYPKRLVVAMAYTFGWKTPPVLVTITHSDGNQQRHIVQMNLPY